MSNSANRDSLLRAFFVGRAIAEIVSEQVERSLRQTLSDLGTFEAEQRENLRRFTEEVLDRADQASQTSGSSSGPGSTRPDPSGSGDLQAELDDLRAEIARLRTELKTLETNNSR